MTTNIIPISTNNPEVNFDIPLILQIAVLLRHWGYSVCPDDGRGSSHSENSYKFFIRANMGLGIGQITERTITQEVVTLTGFLWRKQTVTYVAKSETDVVCVGTIDGPLEGTINEIVIHCRDISYVNFLSEIAAKLQKALGIKVIVRLSQIGTVPQASAGQTLPLLSQNQEATAATLIQQVARRLDRGTQVQKNPDCSIELWTAGEEKPIRLLAISSLTEENGQDVQLHISLYSSQVKEYLEQELAGIEETFAFEGKQLAINTDILY